MEEEKMERAKRVFKALCKALDARGWHYDKGEGLGINCTVTGKDLPMEVRVKVECDRQLIMLLSQLPVVFPEEKRMDGAIAVTVVNDCLVDGSFDYDISNGHLIFRMTSSFIESEIGSELFDYMLMVSFGTIDDYNDKFFMLAKGMLSLEEFMSKI